MTEEPRIRKQLVALYEDTFPKACGKCGKIFDSKESIDQAFKDHKSSCLIEYTYNEPEPVKIIDKDEVVVANYVTCTCGSTLFILFQDRRDQTNQGKTQREAFEALSKEFVSLGFTESNASFLVRALFREMIQDGCALDDILQRARDLLADFKRAG